MLSSKWLHRQKIKVLNHRSNQRRLICLILIDYGMELASNSKIQLNKLIQEICKLKIHQRYLSKAFALIMEHICNNSKGGF